MDDWNKEPVQEQPGAEISNEPAVSPSVTDGMKDGTAETDGAASEEAVSSPTADTVKDGATAVDSVAVTTKTDGVAAKKSSALENAYDLMDNLIAALLVLMVLFCFLFRLVGVDGKSMNDTLADKDRLILQTAFYTPSRGDIVVIYQESEPDKPLIKRVIAAGGDSLRLDVENDAVYLKTAGTSEWVKLNEPYVHYPLAWGILWEESDEVTVPEGHVFVLGDHRNNSRDSRYESVGFVPNEDVIGRAIFRVAPFDSIGTL